MAAAAMVVEAAAAALEEATAVAVMEVTPTLKEVTVVVVVIEEVAVTVVVRSRQAEHTCGGHAPGGDLPQPAALLQRCALPHTSSSLELEIL
jgi:hypothetical protein